MKNKKFLILIIVVLLASLLGIWAVLAFLIPENLIPRFSLWADLVIGTAATILSVLALFIGVFELKKQNKE